MIYNEQPDNFNPKMEVSGCFLECDGEFLILHRCDHKPQGNTWGIPSGKVEKYESPKEAVIREIKEETGCQLEFDMINHINDIYVRHDDYDFVYYMFYVLLDKKPEIILEDDSHKDYKWIKPQDSLQMNNLIQDLDYCIKMFYGIK